MKKGEIWVEKEEVSNFPTLLRIMSDPVGDRVSILFIKSNRISEGDVHAIKHNFYLSETCSFNEFYEKL